MLDSWCDYAMRWISQTIVQVHYRSFVMILNVFDVIFECQRRCSTCCLTWLIGPEIEKLSTNYWRRSISPAERRAITLRSVCNTRTPQRNCFTTGRFYYAQRGLNWSFLSVVMCADCQISLLACNAIVRINKYSWILSRDLHNEGSAAQYGAALRSILLH